MDEQTKCSNGTCNCNGECECLGHKETTERKYPIGTKIILITKDKNQPIQDMPKLSLWERIRDIDPDVIKKKVALRIYIGVLERVDEEGKRVYVQLPLNTPGFDCVNVPFDLKDILYVSEADNSAYAFEIEV